MRSLATALLLASLMLAFSTGPSLAAKPKPPAQAQDQAQADGLRGALSPAKPRPLASPIPALAAAGAYAPAAAPAIDSDRCHMACARSYYFCLAGQAPEQCPQHWISCRSTCAQSLGPTAQHP